MRRICLILSGILVVGTILGSVSAGQEARNPCLAQLTSVDKSATAVKAEGVTYRTAAHQRRQAFELWMKTDGAASKKHETWQAASTAAIKFRDAYNTCLENPSSKNCTPQKKAADEAGLKMAREYRDAVFFDLEAFCAKTALDKAEVEVRRVGDTHQAALKAFQDASAALAQCLRRNKK